MDIVMDENQEKSAGDKLSVENISTKEVETNINGSDNVYEYPILFPSKTLLELCTSSWRKSPRSKHDVQPYLRGCKWSPDGTCCLTVVNNDGVHLCELPRDLYDGSVSPDRQIDVLDTIVHVKEAGLIYDFCWYPVMNSGVPETCCWLTTRQNAPVQMWDAFDGSLRCSYRGFNAVDEMEPATTVTFDVQGSRIIAGYKKVLRTFDIERPGREFAEHKISSPASCFATSSNLVAVGSWNTTINLYNINELGTFKSIGKMHGHGGGVTHMKFTPDGIRLVSGARKDHRLLIWDIRYYRRPLNVLSRVVDTNQRVYFDISPCGKYLVSGGSDGILRVWDVNQIDWKNSLDHSGDMDQCIKFPLHKDCCNSVSIHPIRPIIATGSGQYHFKDPIKLLDQENGHNIQKPESNTSESEVTDKTEMETEKSRVTTENSGIIMEHSGIAAENSAHILDSLDIKETSDEIEDLKYSNHTENSLVFWWTGDIVDLT